MTNPGSEPFQPINSDRRVRQVFFQLQHGIYCGKLRPGEQLREAVLAKNLHVSQATVREALTRLEFLDLVFRTPNRRTEVKNLTQRELRARIEMRVALETLAFIKARKNGLTDSDFAQLDQMAQNIFVDPVGDLKFHRFIWDLSGDIWLVQTLLQKSACLFGFVSILRDANMQDADSRIESHRQLIKALRDADESEITRAISIHLYTAYERFFEEGYPDFRALANRSWRPQFSDIEPGELATLSTV